METPDVSRVRSKSGLLYALLSGILACLAGTFGKFALNSDETKWLCQNICGSFPFNLDLKTAYSFCSEAVLYFQIVAFVVMILINLLMWTTFVKALHFCHTSLEATVTNTAANFFSSALIGRVVFDETTSASLMWWLGTLLILFGLCLMNFSEKGGQLKFGSMFGLRKKKHKSR